MSTITEQQLDTIKTFNVIDYSPETTLRFAPKRISSVSNWDSLHGTGTYGAEFYFTNQYVRENGTVTPFQNTSISGFEYHVQMNVYGSSGLQWIDIRISYEESGYFNVYASTNLMNENTPITIVRVPRTPYINEPYLAIRTIYNSNTGRLQIQFEDQPFVTLPQNFRVPENSLTLFSFGTKLFNNFELYRDAIIANGFLTSAPLSEEIKLTRPLIRTPNEDLETQNVIVFDATESNIVSNYYGFIDYTPGENIISQTSNPIFRSHSVVDQSISGKVSFTANHVSDLFALNQGNAIVDVNTDRHTIQNWRELKKIREIVAESEQPSTDIVINGSNQGTYKWKQLPTGSNTFGFEVEFVVPENINELRPIAQSTLGYRRRTVVQSIKLERKGTIPEEIPAQNYYYLNYLVEIINELIQYRCGIDICLRYEANSMLDNDSNTMDNLSAAICVRQLGFDKKFTTHYQSTRALNEYTNYSYNETNGIEEFRLNLTDDDLSSGSVKVGIYINSETGSVGLIVNNEDYGIIPDVVLLSEKVTGPYDLSSFSVIAETVQLGSNTHPANIDFQMHLNIGANTVNSLFPSQCYDMYGRLLPDNSTSSAVKVPSGDYDFNLTRNYCTQVFRTIAQSTFSDPAMYTGSYNIWESDGNGTFSHTITGSNVLLNSKIAKVKRTTDTRDILNAHKNMMNYGPLRYLPTNEVTINDSYQGSLKSVPNLYFGTIERPQSSMFGVEFHVTNFPAPTLRQNHVNLFDGQANLFRLSFGIFNHVISSTTDPTIGNRNGVKLEWQNGSDTFSPRLILRQFTNNVESGSTLSPPTLQGDVIIGLYQNYDNTFKVIWNGQELLTPTPIGINVDFMSLFFESFEAGYSATDPIVGQTVTVTPVLHAADMVSPFPSGVTDIFGNEISP